MNRRFAVAAGGTAVGAALLLSGCAGDGSRQVSTGAMKLSAAEAVLQSSQKTGQADSFKADLTVTDARSGAHVQATGRFRLRPELTFSAQLQKAEGAGPAGAGGQAIYTGGVLYAKVPQLARFTADGKPWVKVDVAQAGRRAGVDVAGLVEQVQRVDPAEQTKMFTASKDVRRVGEETVDGVRTVHYTGTVTVREALDRLDPDARQRVSRWFPQGASDEKIAFDLWADADQLPRKIVSKGASGDTGSVTVRYSDYGKSFSVNPPPADQVGELPLTGLFGN
ncbi:LppX_LprAFG lipoprotein [Actinomadura keratinilytica]|uniref:LppX_LprAFG lipoprotein n=1 Tax=Actinomadura keratinilytica TaxID=547461 RepID=UPI0031ED3E27